MNGDYSDHFPKEGMYVYVTDTPIPSEEYRDKEVNGYMVTIHPGASFSEMMYQIGKCLKEIAGKNFWK